MNIFEFSSLLNHPGHITAEQTSGIENMLEEYPYFQAARVLYLKGLKDQQSYKYNAALKTAAAYTANRTVLFDFITNNFFDIDEATYKEEHVISDSEVIDAELVDKPVEIDVKDEQFVTDTDSSVKAVEEKLHIGKPLVFDVNEMHSFYEWLQLTSAKPIVREESPSATSEKIKPSVKIDQTRQAKFELIDAFIENNPRLKPLENTDSADISIESTLENESLMTETLARVYLEQKKYDKAIKAFTILSLKFPEKSGFFADRIKAVQFLKQNNT